MFDLTLCFRWVSNCFRRAEGRGSVVDLTLCFRWVRATASAGLRAGAAWSCAGSQGAPHTRIRADRPLPEVGRWRGAEPSALPLVLLYAPFLRDDF